MSAFSRTLRSWPTPQIGYFDDNEYPPPFDTAPANGFSIGYGYGYPPLFQPRGPSERFYNGFPPGGDWQERLGNLDKGGFPLSDSLKLGNLDEDGFPRSEQMLALTPPNVPNNNIHGIYANPGQYFNTHFRLMEEDFMFQLRKAMEEYVFKPDDPDDDNNKFKESKGYKNVRLKNFENGAIGGDKFVTCVMHFENKNDRYKQPSFGDFLVFLKSKGERYPVCVGMVIKDAKQTDEDYSVIRLHFDDPDHDGSDLGNHLFYVLQPNNSFFLSYFCIYNALNGLHSSNKFSKFPMAQYILYGKAGGKIKSPKYLNGETMYRIYGKEFHVLKKGDWPAQPKHLNKSQFTALKRALTEELALVQGPPGTGKTYFGVELVKVLLENISEWNPNGQTPLLVICHSNHALDHFLEKVHEFTDKYVRVGLRCQSEIIKPKCLVELVCRDIANEEGGIKDGSCTCEVVVKRDRKLVVDDLEGYEESDDDETDEDSGHGKDDESEENEDDICPYERCSTPRSKCYCLPALRRCLKQIDETRNLITKLEQGIVNFKLFQFWGVISEEQAQWFEEGRHEDTFLKWLGIDNIKVGNSNAKWLETTNLLVDLGEIKKRIENLNRQSQSAKKLNDAKNRIVNIIEKFRKSSRESIVGDETNIFSLTPIDTRKLYVKWLDRLSCRFENTLSKLEKKLYYNFWDSLPIADRYKCMLKHLQCAHIVGLTSTGAAARRSTFKKDRRTGKDLPREGILEKLASPIGDHQQLKPCISTSHLKQKFLDVSLFERLVKNEVVVQECLKHQNRMRPEIADLLRPHYYSQLFDAPPTRNRDHILGLAHNVFFLDHRNHERLASGDEKGFWNPHELCLLLNLAKFLVTKGYLPSKITIISMYNEQKRKLIEERNKIPCLANMEITSVDGFQGKENDIILLSLVRSNEGGNIGFLSEKNRICVALSRARSGLYIAGNMRCLSKHCEMWRKVQERLNEKDRIGPILNLTCDKHNVNRPLLPSQDWQCEQCSARRKSRQRRRNRRSKKKKNK